MKHLEINTLPVPTWRFLRGNGVHLPWAEGEISSLEVAPTQLEVTEKYVAERYIYSSMEEDEDDSVEQRQGKEYNHGDLSVTLGSGEEKVFLQVLTPDVGKKLQVSTELSCGSDSRCTVVQVFYGDKESVTVNRLAISQEERSEVELVQLMVGDGDVYSDVSTTLAEEGAKYLMDVGYVLSHQRLDMNLVVKHLGKATESDILVEGLLRDGGKKVFRGTIDLTHGAKGSVGKEQENVLLLGDDVENLTIPVLLCSEEDVEGAHGARIGELDEETLFYLNSRGIDKETAEEMMTSAKLSRIVEKIQDESVKREVREILEGCGYDDRS